MRSHIFEPVFFTVSSMWLRGRRTGWAVTVVLEPLQETRVAVVSFAALSPLSSLVAFESVAPVVAFPLPLPLPLPPSPAGCVAVTVAEAGSGCAAPSSFVPVPS